MSDDQGLKDYITHLERELAELRSTLEHIANCANCGIVGNGAAREAAIEALEASESVAKFEGVK